MEDVDLQGCEKYCLLRLEASWFALPAMAVREVLPKPSVIPVPGASPVLAGLCHLRNEFLPVLRLRALAAETGAVKGQEGQLLVMTAPNGPWGLLVDQVAALEALEPSINSEVKQTDDWSAAIMGSATYRDQVVRILDPNVLYRYAENVLQTYCEQAQGVVP